MKIYNPRKAIRSIKDQYSSLITLLREISSFSNIAKNGLHYHAGENICYTLIFTGQIICVDRRDASLAPHLILQGIWEMELTQMCERFVARKKSPTILDVGANFGWYGLVLSRFSPTAKVHFFEANPSISTLIGNTIQLNGLRGRAFVINSAVSDQSGIELRLHVPQALKGSASLHAFNSSIGETMGEVSTSDVQTISIDDYCANHAISEVDFIKIDVEGHEAHVLRGAQNVLNRSKECGLMMEWNCERYPSDIFDLLGSFNFCWGMRADGSFADLTHQFRNASSVETFEKAARSTLSKDVLFDLLFSHSDDAFS